MFSANDMLVLRQHKRRIVNWVEEMIPEELLDLGASVMAMEVSCRAPGCVPLETVVVICFPSVESNLVPNGTTNFKTKILVPMAQVTLDDVLDALPPNFEGGRQTLERTLQRSRDVMLAQIEQLYEPDDLEGRRLMVQYLRQSLDEYVSRNCTLPSEQDDEEAKTDAIGTANTAPVPSNALENKDSDLTKKEAIQAMPTVTLADTKATSETKAATGTGNFIIRRPVEDNSSNRTQVIEKKPASKETAMDWRRRQVMETEMQAAMLSSSSSSQGIIQRLAEREHAPGIRRTGCPCCDPDNPSNVVDSMMML
eukprot:CAMPEP_0198304596 /NCGR_PEP_ID=MMETSP1449-20131203/57484_1 /TAXON_ID=420275 /ORGANISM="Attheya septentrionalis, Strain CCMP2084" /LENGTH=309 /DNA_ID=CAMNT_0044007123 /DNA_START=2699 /DNA_END=3628 /DNA_ORIENTATION=+